MQLDRPFLAITPTVDGDVLAALARVDANLSVSQLQRVIGRYSGEGLRRALSRLVDQGIVRPDQAGNGVAYRLNRAHLLAEAVVAIANAKSRFLESVETAFDSWPAEVRYGAIFGSAARGEMRPASDIDLLLVHDDVANYLMWEPQANELTKWIFLATGNWLSTVSMPVAELRERIKSGDGLIKDVSRDGLTVRGTRSWFDQLMREGTAGAHA